MESGTEEDDIPQETPTVKKDWWGLLDDTDSGLAEELPEPPEVSENPPSDAEELQQFSPLYPERIRLKLAHP